MNRRFKIGDLVMYEFPFGERHARIEKEAGERIMMLDPTLGYIWRNRAEIRHITKKEKTMLAIEKMLAGK